MLWFNFCFGLEMSNQFHIYFQIMVMNRVKVKVQIFKPKQTYMLWFIFLWFENFQTSLIFVFLCRSQIHEVT